MKTKPNQIAWVRLVAYFSLSCRICSVYSYIFINQNSFLFINLAAGKNISFPFNFFSLTSRLTKKQNRYFVLTETLYLKKHPIFLANTIKMNIKEFCFSLNSFSFLHIAVFHLEGMISEKGEKIPVVFCGTGKQITFF